MEKAITEQPKATYLNCLLKAFVLEDGTTTRNTRIAKKHLKNGEEVHMFVHVKGYGQWETSPIQSISGSVIRKVETKNHIYRVRRNEPAHHVQEVRFYVSGKTPSIKGSTTFSSKSYEDVARVCYLMELGCSIVCEVFSKDGHIHHTGNLLELVPYKRTIVTETLSVYTW